MKAYRNRNWIAGRIAALWACLLLFSCNNDEILETGNKGDGCGNICFGVSSGESVQTRGGTAADKDSYTAGRFVLRSDNSDDTLCVRTVVSDGIDIATFAGETPVTRSAPITSLDTYRAFHVLAYWTKGGSLVESQFYMDEDVTDKGNNLWSSDNVYYWPGAESSLQFYAWAPVYAGFTSTPTVPSEDALLGYTVPAEVANQKDVVVASPAETLGDHNAAQLLTFRHICTAVKFAVGSQMQPGTIKRVALKGVRTSGTYNMASDTWSLTNTTGDFTQTLDKTMNGTEAAGTEITTAEQTFMMLPQEQLPEGATVKVVFADNTTGTERILTAPIAGTEWPQGKTVTYRLSITPEYELEFVDEPVMQDAHYVIYPIRINAGDVDGGWTLTSTNPAVTLRSSLTTLTRRGFWVEEDRGTESISSTAVGEVTVYAFIEENVGDDKRDVTLELRPTNMPNATPATFVISQYCPSWNGNIGCERIEDGDYPWGFLWDADMIITYDVLHSDLGLLGQALLTFYLAIFDNSEFVRQNVGVFPLRNEIIIDFSKISSLNVATDLDNGWQNTLEVYNFDGINDASSMMQMLEEMGVHADKELPTNPTEFAARACALKNKFNKEISQEQGQTVERAVLRDENLVWYLPAANEASLMNDEEVTPLSGEYWTSTAVDDNQRAYKYTAGGTTSPELRDKNLHVRAVRRR